MKTLSELKKIKPKSKLKQKTEKNSGNKLLAKNDKIQDRPKTLIEIKNEYRENYKSKFGYSNVYKKVIDRLYERYNSIETECDNLETPQDRILFGSRTIEIGIKLIDALSNSHNKGIINVIDSKYLDKKTIELELENLFDSLMQELQDKTGSEVLTYIAQRDLIREELKKDLIDKQILDLLTNINYDINIESSKSKIDILRKLVSINSKKPSELLRLAEYVESVEKSKEKIDILEVLEN